MNGRDNGKPKIGKDIPTRDEVRRYDQSRKRAREIANHIALLIDYGDDPFSASDEYRQLEEEYLAFLHECGWSKAVCAAKQYVRLRKSNFVRPSNCAWTSLPAQRAYGQKDVYARAVDAIAERNRWREAIWQKIVQRVGLGVTENRDWIV